MATFEITFHFKHKDATYTIGAPNEPKAVKFIQHLKDLHNYPYEVKATKGRTPDYKIR